MKQGRRRSDGGAAVLENNMKKMKGYNSGGTRRSTDPEPTIKLTDEQKKEIEALGYGDESPLYDTLPRDLRNKRRSNRKSDKSGTVEKGYETYASGGSMKVKGYKMGGSCRGGGAAIQGTKFSGEF